MINSPSFISLSEFPNVEQMRASEEINKSKRAGYEQDMKVLVSESFFNKVATFLKKGFQHSCFPVNIGKF